MAAGEGTAPRVLRRTFQKGRISVFPNREFHLEPAHSIRWPRHV